MTKHVPSYSSVKDSGCRWRYWTVTCRCGFTEHGSTRQVVRDEFAHHQAVSP